MVVFHLVQLEQLKDWTVLETSQLRVQGWPVRLNRPSWVPSFLSPLVTSEKVMTSFPGPDLCMTCFFLLPHQVSWPHRHAKKKRSDWRFHLWKIWVRQLGWLFPIYGKIKVMFQSPPTSDILDPIDFTISPTLLDRIYHGDPWIKCITNHPLTLSPSLSLFCLFEYERSNSCTVNSTLQTDKTPNQICSQIHFI